MKRSSPISRRTFLKGCGVSIALPFLDAMIPCFAHGQVAPTKRFLVAFNGSVVASAKFSVPANVGAFNSALPASWAALEPVKQYISLVSGMQIPVYNPSLGEAFIPGGSHSGTHGFTRGPILSGMGSYDGMLIHQACKTSTQPGNQTCDQYAADVLSGSTKFRSLELKVQAVPYNGNPSSSNGSMSARRQNGIVSKLEPIVSPVTLFNMLFGTTSSPTAPSAQLAREKSVLDLVLEDANRLINSLGGEDKARMELHFEEIRNVEKSISSQLAGTSTGGSLSCSKPSPPPADTPPDSLNFGGWADETQRGQIQADLIAYAFACDLTRVVSWMMTHDQCWLNSNKTGGSTVVTNAGGTPEIHSDSHSAPASVQAANCNWHASLYARLIQNLIQKSDANGPLIDNTFLNLVSAEGGNAHSRSGFVHVVAGNGSRLNLGHHISALGLHPARVLISGLQSVGVNMNDKMGQVTGTISGLLK